MRTILRSSLLFSRRDGSAAYIHDGCIVSDTDGRITFVGPWEQVAPQFGPDVRVRHLDGAIVIPAMLDLHTHVSQHGIRGRFLEGVEQEGEQGRLVAGLMRNVFPEEMRCADPVYAAEVARGFAADARANGVIGGVAFMTSHPAATAAALEVLGEAWHVGLVLMDQNCPEGLRTNADTLERDVAALVERFGKRVILADRFALSCSSPLRRQGVELARRYGLRIQTHLNEQVAEKWMVEQTLYPEVGSYAGVYARDGLLSRNPILAHCVHNRADELRLLREAGATVAHCPVSNALLGSGIMRLDKIAEAGIEWCLCTDVGASPSVSLLVEMSQFLIVHRGRSRRATPAEALYRTTLAPARVLGLDGELGSFEPGMRLAYLAVEPAEALPATAEADVVIKRCLLGVGETDYTEQQGVLDALWAGDPVDGTDLQRLLRAVEAKAGDVQNRIRQVGGI